MASKTEAIYYASPVWLQNLLVSLMGYRLYRKRYTAPYLDLLAQVRESRCWNRQQRDDYQSEQLHRLIRHCSTQIPYYQQLFAEHGFHHNQFTSLPDLRKLPILDKQTLRARPEAFRSNSGRPYMMQNTSGSTGTPLTLAVNEQTYKTAMALLVDHEEHHGVPFRSRRATFAGRMVQRANDTKPPFARTNLAENQRLYSSYHLNRYTFPYYREDLDRFAPLELIGYPSAICDLASHYLATGTRPCFQTKAIVTNSETLLEWQRQRIEQVFGCQVRDYYGTAEYVVFAGQDQQGIYRTSPVLGITEVIAEGSTDGEGELIATSLTNDAMPLLRYRIGDSATPALGNDAGDVVRVDALARINGRIDDYIHTADGRRIGRIDHIFKGVTGVREAQVIQDQPDHCIVKVVVDESINTFDEGVLIGNLLYRTGNSMRVSVEKTSQIERGPNGKFKAVISLVKPV